MAADSGFSKGLESVHISSDEKHFGEFVCVVCLNVSALDAVVATRCSHPFCTGCLQSWVSRGSADGPHRCPSCSADLVERNCASQSNHMSMLMNGVPIAARPMSEAQPLAYRIFGQIQVRCPLRKTHQCSWEGDYSSLRGHFKNGAKHKNGILQDESTKGSGSNSGYSGSKYRQGLQDESTFASGSHSGSTGSTNMFSASRASQSRTRRRNGRQASSRRVDPVGQSVKVEQRRSVQTPASRPDPILQNARKKGAALKERANTAFKTEKYQEAEALYSQAIAVLCEARATDPADCETVATLFSNRAAAWLRLGEYENASNDCSSAIRLNPQFTKAYIRKSTALIELGRIEEACRYLKEGKENNSDADNIKDELRKVQNLNDRLQKADRLLKQDEYNSARDTLLSLQQSFAQNMQVLSLSAEIELGLGNIEAATNLSRSMLKRNPRNLDALCLRGRASFLEGEFSASTRYLKDALRYDPDSSRAKSMMRKLRMVEGAVKTARDCMTCARFKEAVERYTEALQNSAPLPTGAPLFGILHTEMGEAYFSLGKYDAALTETKLAISAREDCEIGWITRIMVYEALEAYDALVNELGPLLRTPWGAKNDFVRAAYEKAAHELERRNRVDFYRLLGVSPDATVDEIRRQYKQKAFEFHPDRYSGLRYTKIEREEAEEKFKLLGEALEVLCDRFQRKLYDEGYGLEEIREKQDDSNRERRRAAQQRRHATGKAF